MAEKGGKGFSSSLPLKSTPSSSSKGKDNTSAKKRGRKPRANPQGSLDDEISNIPKSIGKGDNPAAKANGSKGDKGATMNGGTGKAPVPKQPSKLELRVENDLPQNAVCLMDCEAALILEGIQDQMAVLSEDPSIKIPISFNRGLQYAKTGDHYTNPRTARRVIEKLKVHGVTDGEICMIANICPETIEEVFASIPSLKAKRSTVSEHINEVLRELAMLKHPTQYDDIF